jgi:HPt (histidine-containing phosphotransfer) domain-containing protein
MNSDQIINPHAIDALRAVSPEDGGKFLSELVDIFLADTPPRLAEIDTALAARDSRTLTRAAHSIKGSAGNFGAERLSRVAQEIEAAAKENNFALAAEHAPALHREFAAAEALLRTLRVP